MFKYGIDAPWVVFFLLMCAIGLPLGQYYFLSKFQIDSFIIFGACSLTAATLLLTALAMLVSSACGKLYLIRRILNKIPWRGNEQVLDVGCGKGLVAIEVAHYLHSQGSVVGIDIFSKVDLSGNSKQAVLDNIKKYNLTHQISIEEGSVCNLPFGDAMFDVVIANLVIHNIENIEDRFVAIDQMLRVLKSGGILVINDMFCTTEYFQYLSICDDIESIYYSGFRFWTFPPSRTLIVVKK